MAYIDTTLTPESGYTHVNYRQVYDVIAAELTSHAAWDFVETVDYTTSGQTHRSHVWKCNASSSGLPEDFFVVFTLQFTVSGTVWQTLPGIGLQISLGEGYNSTTHVLTKYAPYTSSATVTIGADRSAPGSWNLSTQIKSSVTAPYPSWVGVGPLTNQTSHRMFVITTNDALLVFSAHAVGLTAYAGVIESTMDSTDDPMPLFLGASRGSSVSSSASAWAFWNSTRHPKLTPSTAYQWVFQFEATTMSHRTSGNAPIADFSGAIEAPYSNGTVGTPSDATVSMFTGVVPVAKIPLATAAFSMGAQSASTRGGRRGYLKYAIMAPHLAAHTAGDTFLVDGKVHLGLGAANFALWNTEAV